MLTCDRVRLEFDDFSLTADFSVPAGARIAVMGPSGAGKSTFLAAVAGYLPLKAGRIVWDGRDLAALAPGARPVSMLFQDNNLFPHLSVAQNVGLGLRPDLRLTAADHQRVAAVLDAVGLEGCGARLPAALSGGQAGRVALARVLLRARPLVLLDEPFAALGPALKTEMLALVMQIAAQTQATLLMVTHDPQDALAIADSVIVVADGKLSAPVATDALFADPPPALRLYLGSAPGMYGRAARPVP